MTFSKLMKKWMHDNNIESSVGYERFGKTTFWNWMSNKSVPTDNRIPEISDKTGISVKDITDAINESRANAMRVNDRPAPTGDTLGKMLGRWMKRNGLTRKDTRSLFGFGFDKWILDQCVPAESKIGEISKITGYPVEELNDGIRRTREHMQFLKDGKSQVAKFNRKYGKVEEHTQQELEEEADAVRKLKAGLEEINMNHSDDCAKDTTDKPDPLMEERTTVGNPLLNPNIIMEVPEPKEKESFDNLLVRFAETYKQIGDIERQIVKLQALQSDLEMKLMTIKKQIRSAA